MLGTKPSALALAGFAVEPGTGTAITETWNGSSWTEVADLNTAKVLWVVLELQHLD